MENAYGIGVTNRYQLFLDNEDDPLEVLKVQEQEKEAKKKTKLSEKENKGKPDAKGKVPPVARKGIKETQNLKSQDVPKPKEDFNKAKSMRTTGDRVVKYNNENREERNNRKNREDKPSGEYHREDRGEGRFERRDRDMRTGDSQSKEFRSGETSDTRGRGRGISGRGLSRGRGRGGRGGYDGRGKREFDRQSGSAKTEVNNSTQQNADDSGDWSIEKIDGDNPPTETGEQKDSEPVGTSTENEETAPHVEEEQKEMTLDEYRALKGTRQKPQYNIRKAGEGEDPSQWKKMYALQKKKEGDEEEEEEEEYDSSDYPQRVGRQKRVLGIEINFADNVRAGGRGRGGRGIGRGGPRGGSVRTGNMSSGMTDRGQGSGMRDRDPRGSRQSAPKVDDEHDFPSLG
ncbi:uncharacterized protein LOC142323226 isoform X2 [Lycorma delicatula]|uniref:uncharacterized protein LOC142323226 isoform X2 n=1 Tax=Lycorma delicatula TaxID=130591 RepID=UPI003F51916A